ncbi:myosin-9-like [Physella acuta]|uniref:myosin-9-like n=1 Tax=Physella acuta TaxID=109671 RepID=UPI0027DC7A51|nr:myosin-9-like [Physella acuta]
MLLKLSDDHFVQRKKSMKLKVQLEQVQNELNEIKRRLREEENESQLASDSAATTPVHFVHRSDYEELLKKQEEMQTKLARLEEEYSHYKLSCEKLEEEKDEQIQETTKNLEKQNQVLHTELDHLKKEFSDRKDSYEKLHQEKEVLQTELDHLKKEFSDRKDSYEKLHQEKEFEEAKNKQMLLENQTLENSFKIARRAANIMVSNIKEELATPDLYSIKMFRIQRIIEYYENSEYDRK